MTGIVLTFPDDTLIPFVITIERGDDGKLGVGVIKDGPPGMVVYKLTAAGVAMIEAEAKKP